MIKKTTPGISHQARKSLTVRKNALKKDISKAATTNAKTLGGGAKKAETEQKKDVKRSEQKEVFTRQTPDDSPQSKGLEEQKPAVEQQDVPKAQVEDAPQQEAKVEPKKSEAMFEGIAGLLSENVSQEEMGEIGAMAAANQAVRAQEGKSAANPAHLMVHASMSLAAKKLRAKMPNATPAEVKEAAKSDPEIAKWSKVLDAGQEYANQVKTEQSEAKAAGVTEAPGASVVNGAAANGAPAAAAPEGVSQVDPFAVAKGQGGDGGDGQNGLGDMYKLDPEKQAQMMADNMKTMDAIRTIYAEMWANMQKEQAKRHQIMMETANFVSDTVMKTFMNRQASAQAHQNSFMAYITEAK